MKKQINKFLIMALVLVLAVFFCSCATPEKDKEAEIAGKSETDKTNPEFKDETTSKGYLNTESQFPIVKEPLTLKIMAKLGPSHPNFEEIYNLKQYEEMTGVTIEWINVPSDSWGEQLNLTMASGEKDMPDAILKGNISLNDQLTWGKDGLIIDLTEENLLEDYAPNFTEYMAKYDDVRQSQTFPNGSIYSIPAATEADATRINRKLFINRPWLDVLELEMPTDYEEFYDVLKAFKEGDPNGNGKADEIPLYASANAIYEVFYGMFGLENRGTHHQQLDMDEDTGKIRYFAIDDAYRDFLTYLNRLYSEGLIHQEIYTHSDSQNAAYVSQDLLGATINTALAYMPSDKVDNFEGIPEALEGPHGDKLWSPIRSHLHSSGAFVITSACKYPEVALRWVDFFYSDEGCLFYHYGVEGETFVSNEDGTYDYTQDIYDQMTGDMSYDAVVSQYTPYPYGNNPTIMKEPYFSGAELTEIPMDAAAKVKPYVSDEIWPFFTFTEEENTELVSYKSDIDSYVKESTAKFITGEIEINDATWNDYVAEVKNMGVDKVIEIYETAYARIK